MRSLINAKGNTIVPTKLQKQRAIMKIPTAKFISCVIGINNIIIRKNEKQAKIRQIVRVFFNPNFSESFFQIINEAVDELNETKAIKINSLPLREIAKVAKFKSKN